MSNIPGIKNIHLVISTIIILPVAIAYGVSPKTVLPVLFDFKAGTTDLTNIFRATMGLYLAMCSLWITGIFKPGFWFTATIVNILFMGGLAFGRLISLAADGLPSVYLLTGLILESTLAIWGLINLRVYK